jgi:fructose transport system substrate-binding protein
VIALDTPLDPIDAADATFATDNFQAGLLIGQWAKATLGDAAANAKIALLDLDQPAFGRRAARPGLPEGFGIDTGDIPNGATRPIRASSATKSPPATRKAA